MPKIETQVQIELSEKEITEAVLEWLVKNGHAPVPVDCLDVEYHSKRGMGSRKQELYAKIGVKNGP